MNHPNTLGALNQRVEPCAPRATMDDRLETLNAVCRRLQQLENRFFIIADRIRLLPQDPSKLPETPEPGDMVGKFGRSLDYACDRLIALEDLAARIDSDLFGSANKASAGGPASTGRG